MTSYKGNKSLIFEYARSLAYSIAEIDTEQERIFHTNKFFMCKFELFILHSRLDVYYANSKPFL